MSQVEHGAEYRRALDELHELTSAFQRGLEGSQRELWLAVEEALLAHAERLHRAYYHAGFRHGVDWGWRAAQERPRRSSTGGVRAEAGAVVAAGVDCVAAFARLLHALASRS